MCSPGRTHRAVGVGLASDRSIWFGFRPHDSRSSLPRDRKSEGQDVRERQTGRRNVQRRTWLNRDWFRLDTCYFCELYDYRQMRRIESNEIKILVCFEFFFFFSSLNYLVVRKQQTPVLRVIELTLIFYAYIYQFFKFELCGICMPSFIERLLWFCITLANNNFKIEHQNFCLLQRWRFENYISIKLYTCIERTDKC